MMPCNLGVVFHMAKMTYNMGHMVVGSMLPTKRDTGRVGNLKSYLYYLNHH